MIKDKNPIGWFIGNLFKKPGPSEPAVTEPEQICTDEPARSCSGDEFVSFKLTENSCTADDMVQEGIFTDNGVTLKSYLSRPGYSPGGRGDKVVMINTITGGDELAKEVRALLASCNARKWNGFHGNNPPGVLDGSSMRFEAELADGSTISASGTNNFPRGYGELRSGLAAIFDRGVVESSEFTYKGLTFTLPEELVGKAGVKYYTDDVRFTIDEGKKTVLTISAEEYGYAYPDSDTAKRVGILKADGDELYFAISYSKDIKDKAAGIASGARALSGQFTREDGIRLYKKDARQLFDKARSLWLSLTLCGEYPAGCSTIEHEGRKYITFSPSYETWPVRSVEMLREKMSGLFTEELIDRVIAEKESRGAFLVANNRLYVDHTKIKNKTRFGGFGLGVPVMDADGAGATVIATVHTASDRDEAYSYSLRTDYPFHLVRTQRGWLFDTFDFWEEGEWV